jgi:hypothetical protein
MREDFRPFLEQARDSLEKSIEVAKNECVLAPEFDSTVNLAESLRTLAKVYFLFADYRPRIDYKYPNYAEKDKERKKKLGITEEEESKEDAWETQKKNNEILEIINYKRKAVYCLEASVNATNAEKELMDRYPQIGVTNLTDPSKIPKEIAAELFESNAIHKLGYKKIPDFEAKEKLAITSCELLAFLRCLYRELQFFCFGCQKKANGMAKLHRYLKINLATYVQKCTIEFKIPDSLSDAAAATSYELIQKCKLN